MRPAEEELFLPRVKARWDTVEEFVEKVARLEILYTDWPVCGWSTGVVGVPPTGDAALASDGTVRCVDGERGWSPALHEAIHWMYPWSLEDEEGMMPLQLEIVRALRDDEQRHACLEEMLCYGVSNEVVGTEIGDLVERHQERWVRTRLWQKCVRTAKHELECSRLAAVLASLERRRMQ